MSGNYKNTSGYSASDIQKYWRGELSARDMQELEKAALEDPFLADALEGMELHQALPEPAAFDRDLEELQARLQARVAQKEDKKAIPFLRPRMRVAAAVILLVGLGTAAYYALLKGPGQREPVASAVHAEKDLARQPAPVTADSIVMAPPVASNGQQADKEKEEKESDLLIRAKKNTRRQEMAIARAEARKKARIDSEREQAYQSADTAFKSDLAAKSEKDKASDNGQYLPSVQLMPRVSNLSNNNLANTQKDTVSYNAGYYALGAVSSRAGQLPDRLAFSGKVLDEHNRPVNGASVYLNGHSDISTVTDRHGLFNLKLHQQEKDSALKLMVAHVGYEQTSIALNTLDQQNAMGNIIRLQPEHPSLDEVVVAGYGRQRRETFSKMATDNEEKIDTLWLKATPVTGRLLYLDYLATARKKLILDSTIKGDEIISFDVNKKGELSSFRVEQSLSPAHDSSIIRLVREGPPWKLLRGRQARAALRVSF